MTTDHSKAIEHLRDRADEFDAWRNPVLAVEYRAAADALEALTAERTITINDTAVEAIAVHGIKRWEERYNATLESQGYSRKAELARIREETRTALEAAYAAQNPGGDTDEH